MNYEEAVHYIKNEITPGSVYGLERVSELARRLGVPDENTKLIHIAGTNGKGSTSRMLMSVLKEAGFTVGIFNSPFLVAPTEYLCINGENASKEEYANIITDIRYIIDIWAKEEKCEISKFITPTEFEISVCASLLYFKNKQCDYCILECGLGGESDATNFIKAPELAIITNIGIDHTGLLGNTISEIATQKSGIIKYGSEVVVYPSCNEALNIFAMKAIKENCGFYVADINTESGEFNELTSEMALKGKFQKKNAAVVLKAVEILNKKIRENNTSDSRTIEKNHIISGLKNVVWPGRFEILSQDPFVIIDGGHNDQCIDALCDALDSINLKNAIFVVGVMADKTHKEMFGKLSKYVKYVITTEPANDRRLSANDSLEEWKTFGVNGEVVKSPSDAIIKALELSNGKENIVVSGSLYMVGEIRNSYFSAQK